jgi:16S rRNA (cytosine1402-N4)-methyltransferase
VHAPVMLNEVIYAIGPKAGGVYLDGTLGAGGYSERILKESAPDGIVIGLDLDSSAIDRAGARLSEFGSRFSAFHCGFHEAKSNLIPLGIDSFDGIVLDLGLSSNQVDDPDRGFSFRFTGPLDMRFDRDSGEGALALLQETSLKKLEEILATYGEERYCKQLARGILNAVERGDIKTTDDLVKTIERIIGNRRGKIHPATRTFQALRIAVNRELENLERALDELPQMLKVGGRLCIVSYHSLEDRLVKLSFRERAKDKLRWKLITKKVIIPSDEERRANPRSRSAKMRVLEALARESQ